MPNEYEQPVEPMSRTEDLLRTGTEEPVIAMSEIEKILRGEHIDRPHSRVADLLLQYNPSDILIEKSITENGTYYASADGADGYYKVVVDTPVIPPTVLEHLVETISTNGTHTFTPETGVDGFSDASITVNVPANVTSRGLQVNGTFASSVDNKDGYNSVTVNVQEAPVKTTSLSVTANGTYEPGPASELSLTIPTIPDEVETDVSAGATITNFDNLRVSFTNKTTGVTGYVDIYPGSIAIQSIPMSFKNRTLIMAPDGDHYITLVNGGSSIIVLQKGYTITAMRLTSESGYFSSVDVDVQPATMEKSITINGTYLASDDNVYGYSKATVNVPPVPVLVAKQIPNLPAPIASFSDGAVAPMMGLKVGIEPQQEGSGDPSPTNVRPISGWTEVDVTRTGKNLLNESALSNNRLIDGNGNENDSSVTKCTEFYIKIKGLDTITVSYDYESLAYFNNRYYAFYDENKDFVSSGNYIPTSKVNQISIPNNAVYIRISFDMNVTNIMIEKGNAPTTYEPYAGNTYTIDLDGTRYGGEVDVVNGVLTVDRVEVDMGSLSWANRNNNIFSTKLNDAPQGNSFSVICERYKTNNVDAGTLARLDYTLSTYPSYDYKTVMIRDSNYSTDADFKNSLDGVKMVYKLATPIAIQLTPTQVKSLPGQNNIWADTGNVLEGEYLHVNTEVGTLVNKTITQNGSYCAARDDDADGYLTVNANIPLGTKSMTSNGTYTASDDNLAGYSQVTVNVPPVGTIIPTIKLESTITITTEVV